jgi:DNA modification methylase
MRSTSNPKQTLLDTGKELVTRGAFVHPVAASQHVRQAEIVAKHFDNPKILNARNVGEAYGLVLKLEEEKIRAAMARKDIASGRGLADLEVRLADLVLELPKLDANTFDLILADPPYGIDAASAGFRSRTVHHHNYTDDVQTARHLAQTIISEGFRVCKPRANLFLFTDIKHWEWLQQHSAAAGWTPFRRPLIWGKSDTEGFAPWGSQGPRITTEFIFFATKGQKGLIASPTDYLRVNRVSRSERLHAAEKPVELLRKLIECSTQPNDFILDPCCGSGSTLVAAKESRRRALGIERDHDYHTTALANLYNTTKDEQVELPI